MYSVATINVNNNKNTNKSLFLTIIMSIIYNETFVVMIENQVRGLEF